MENTRNEKAAIMVCTYIIGFTTAYIGYGITFEDSKLISQKPVTNEFVHTEESDIALSVENVAESVDPVNAETETVSPEVAGVQANNGLISGFSITDKGLEVVRDGVSRLISMNHLNASPEALSGNLIQGVHQEVFSVAVSNSGDYLYFCEQAPGESGCVPFVYDANNDAVRPVMIENSSADVNLSQLVWRNDILVSNEAQSVSKVTPWNITIIE